MKTKFDYTRNARRFVARAPVFTFILTQVVCWIVAYAFLAIIAHMVLLIAGPALQIKLNLSVNLVIAVFFGFFYGIVSGSVGLFFGRMVFYKKALWVVIIFKAVIAFFIFIILISVVRSVLYPYLYERYFHGIDTVKLERSWEVFFQLLLIYTIAVGLLINFINQVNKKYGPGVLLPILLGRYRKPKEEEMIFLIMDLKSSTSIAEALGHLKYSAFIRDSFWISTRCLLATMHRSINM